MRDIYIRYICICIHKFIIRLHTYTFINIQLSKAKNHKIVKIICIWIIKTMQVQNYDFDCRDINLNYVMNTLNF